MPPSSLEFPPLFPELLSQERVWPRPPFEWPTSSPSPNDPHRCRIENLRSEITDVELLALNPEANTATIRARANAPSLKIRLSEVQRLTLVDPLRAVLMGDGVVRRISTRDLEHDYVVEPSDPRRDPLTGRAVGHVVNAEG